MNRLLPGLLALSLMGIACFPSNAKTSLVIGAVYPLGGSQASGGLDEYRGVLLATQLANEDGGARGRPIQLRTIDVEGLDAAPAAIEQLHAAGIVVVLGSYGSTISAAASAAAAERHMLFWETGAVGMFPAAADAGSFTFRVPPTGGTLGRAAIDFVSGRLASVLHRDPGALRFAVAYVNDVYGSTVAQGAERELRARGLELAAAVPYPPVGYDPARIVRRIAAAHPDVLFVSAYLDDGIAVRRELVRRQVPLLASIGTSSSYCMPQFGDRLGRLAVGVFASDKPDADSLDADSRAVAAIRPDAAALLRRANSLYRGRWGADMSAAALAGFSGAWALFHVVLPRSSADTPTAIAEAARSADLPLGSLPNGSGLRFGPAGTPEAGANLAAASVIWEWVAPGRSVIVWPPAYATHPVETFPAAARK